MSVRRDARRLAVQFLFQLELNPAEKWEPALEEFYSLQDEPPPEKAREFARVLVRGVIHFRKDLDDRLQSYLVHWRMDRLGGVDRAVLRLALFEMLHRDDIPPMVSLHEALDLAKSLGGEDSSRFVNGVLDRAMQDCGRPLRSAKTGKKE